jgi:hypothetical protein
MDIIINNADALTLTEQKFILLSNFYEIITNENKFFSIVLYLPDKTLQWKPQNIDEAIIYCKKNNIKQINYNESKN